MDPSADISAFFCSFIFIFPSWSLLLLDYTYVNSIIHDDPRTVPKKHQEFLVIFISTVIGIIPIIHF